MRRRFTKHQTSMLGFEMSRTLRQGAPFGLARIASLEARIHHLKDLSLTKELQSSVGAEDQIVKLKVKSKVNGKIESDGEEEEVEEEGRKRSVLDDNMEIAVEGTVEKWSKCVEGLNFESGRDETESEEIDSESEEEDQGAEDDLGGIVVKNK
ncbi:hypothetical protein U1Q18_031275 [Sarracenia purpurea var. burkii]